MGGIARWMVASAGGIVALALVFGGGLGAGVASSAPADDGVDALGLPTDDAIVGQDMVMAVVQPVLDLVNPNEGGSRVSADGVEYGYAGVMVDPVARVVDLFWVGEVAVDVQRMLDDAPSEVTVRVHPAKFTLFEMLDAVDRVVGMPIDESGASSSMISAAGPDTSGNGIWVEYTGTAAPDTVAALAARLAKVDITTVSVGQEIQSTARWNGTAPYKGGGGYYVGGLICSTSFPVTSNATGTKYLLTANHCFPSDTTVSVSNDVGTWGIAYTGTGYRHPDLDAALVRPTTQSITPRIYYGTWSTANLEIVGAVGGNVVGAFACADGANSGVHCVEIDQANYAQYISDQGSTVHGLVRGHVSVGSVVVVGGDSGGPVAYPQSSGKFRAMGTILGGYGSGTCPVVRYSTTKCFTNVVWVGSVTISSEMGMTIATG